MPHVENIIIVGSGPSSGTPCVKCFIEGVQDEIGPCARCMSGVMDTARDGSVDGYRMNPQTMIEVRGDDGGELKRVLIDFGKTTRDAILSYFFPKGISKIDAVICTHGHADAYMGMMDLACLIPRRGRGCETPMFTDEKTMQTIDRCFPGFVAPAAAAEATAAAAPPVAASASASAASLFSRHVIAPFQVFEACGIEIQAFHVDHGVDCLAFAISLEPDGKLRDGGQTCIFVSDAGRVPDEVRKEFMRFSRRVTVMDLLRETHYQTHMGRREAVEEAKKIGAAETFWIGTSHGFDRNDQEALMHKDDAETKTMRFSRDGMVIYSATTSSGSPAAARNKL